MSAARCIGKALIMLALGLPAVAESQNLNTAFVSQSVPALMAPGQTYPVSVTLKNTGLWGWGLTQGYKLGSQNPQDNTTWGTNGVPLTQFVYPGENVTFNFNVTAPTTPGTYNFQWRMFRPSYGWFGVTTPNVAVQVGVLDAQLVSQSVPPIITPGASHAVTVTMQNTGSLSWSAGTVSLGSQNPVDNTTWGLSRVPLNAAVAPGQSVTLNFNVTAPSTPGIYNFQWRMVDNGLGWFGPNTTNVAVQSGVPGAQFVSQSVPTAMVPGQTYPVSVTMENSGSTAWSAGTYRLGSQNPQDNSVWGLSRVELAAPVAPGANVTFNFDVTAPAASGPYNFQWRLLQGDSNWFGTWSQNVTVAVGSTQANMFFIHVDHLNTPRLVANAAGQTVWLWHQAEPFGNNVPDENPSGLGTFDLPLRFPGQRYDAETGLHYNYYRDYDPSIGRYGESDPIGLKGGLNTYAYVLSSPLFWVDPFGLYTYCRLLSQKCTDSKTIRMGLGLIKVEICVRRRCLWRCYDDPVGKTMCYNIPCKDGHCQGDHGVEVLEYHGAGSPEYPLGAAPLCEDKNPAAGPSTPSSPGQQ